MKYSEYQLDLQGGKPEDLPAPAPAVFPKRCLRQVPAREWIHHGWITHSLMVAGWCLSQNPDCKKCRQVFDHHGRGSL